jgi:hypothetical protein
VKKKIETILFTLQKQKRKYKVAKFRNYKGSVELNINLDLLRNRVEP